MENGNQTGAGKSFEYPGNLSSLIKRINDHDEIIDVTPKKFRLMEEGEVFKEENNLHSLSDGCCSGQQRDVKKNSWLWMLEKSREEEENQEEMEEYWQELHRRNIQEGICSIKPCVRIYMNEEELELVRIEKEQKIADERLRISLQNREDDFIALLSTAMGVFSR